MTGGRGALRAAGLALAMAFASHAGAQTAPLPNLADLRADLDAVAADLQALRASLRVSGTAGYAAAGGPDAITRMDRMEAVLRQLTGTVEEARNRIESITTDAAQRLDEVEFRLCQLEPDCDLAALTTGDGWDMPPGAATPALPSAAQSVPASADEQAAFDRAAALLAAGDPQAAVLALAEFARDHAGSPLFADARFLEGRAHLALGDAGAAARAFVDVFTADPENPHRSEALLAMARIVAEDGASPDDSACLFLSEVLTRHADSASAADAAQLYDRLSCAALPDPGPEG